MSDEERERKRAGRVKIGQLIRESSIGEQYDIEAAMKQEKKRMEELLVEMTPNDPWILVDGQPYFKYEVAGIDTWVTLFPDEYGTPYFKTFHNEEDLTGED